MITLINDPYETDDRIHYGVQMGFISIPFAIKMLHIQSAIERQNQIAEMLEDLIDNL